ncbi:hypothetical protein C8J57DRAFT_1249375 [Mycena rebaudengoi]|nr:hypothetical protein C8J57DRAFT_1249375 [Mycena rebaudengoi]
MSRNKIFKTSTYDHLRRIFPVCTVYDFRNINKCAVPEDVRWLMRGLVCVEHDDWDGTLLKIREKGGKAGNDWVNDKESSKFFFPIDIWNAGDANSNLIESVHRDVNREGVHCTLLGGLKKGQSFDTYESYGITPSKKTGHISENVFHNLKRKSNAQHRVLVGEDQKIERHNEKLLKSLNTVVKAEKAVSDRSAHLASVTGYIGCFKIIQSSTGTVGPLVWLSLELILSSLRLGIWAANPTTDDPPPPIVISSGSIDSGEDTVAHDIGWKLEDVTVDMHAVVIDIVGSESQEGDLQWPMFQYLTKHLAVPEDQVRHVRGSSPSEIQDALHSLEKNIGIPRGSPIVMYISHHSDCSADSKWIGNNDHGLLHSSFFKLVRRISGTKGENVVVILDTNYPALGTEAEYESEPHVLITACSSRERPQSENSHTSGGSFTMEFLDTLESAAVKNLSYDEVVKNAADNFSKTQEPNSKVYGDLQRKAKF